MSEPTDQHLLNEWAARHSEAAFRSLLGRHGGFVYGAALRRAGDAGLAEEITQDVFARLAQNARRLVSHPTLAGWLHRTTMLIALDRIRRMTRSARRLAELSTMNRNARDPWEEILPHLDKALDCLGPREREVVMLHFIERRSFPEIARAIGGTPDAARMRANRALASLARLLGKKGSTVAAATLAAGLGAAVTHAMPASIAALTPQAIAGMGKVSVLSFVIHSIQTMKTAETAAAIALALALALATPLVIQQGEIAAAEARIAKLQQQAGGPQGKTVAQPSAPALAAGAGAGLDLRQLGDDALEEGAHAKRRIRIALARLDANNLTGLIETVLHGGMMIAKREALLEALLRELRSRDPAQFLAWTMKVYATLLPDGVVGLQSSNFAFGFRSTACDAFREWVAVKPAEAEAWAEGNREAWAEFVRGPGLLPMSDVLTTAGLLKSDPERAYATLDKKPLSFCLAIFLEAGRSLSESQIATFTQWAAALPDVEKRRHVTRQALVYAPVKNAKEGKLERLNTALRGLQMNEEDATWIATRLVLDSVFRVEDDLSKVPKAELEWVEKNIAPARQDYVKGALGHLFEPKQAMIFLGQQLDASPNDDLIAGYVESEDMRWHGGSFAVKGGRHGETAFKLAMRTSDPARRSELLVRAWTDLHKDSATAARQILETPELDAEDRAALETRIAPLVEKKP